METNPEGTAQTYIFLVDNQDIALNIVMSGYQALCLVQEDDGYYFSADSFIEEMRAIQFTGSCQSAYHYVTALITQRRMLLTWCWFSGGEMTGKFRKVASHSAPEPAFGLFLNLPEGSAPWNPGTPMVVILC